MVLKCIDGRYSTAKIVFFMEKDKINKEKVRILFQIAALQLDVS